MNKKVKLRKSTIIMAAFIAFIAAQIGIIMRAATLYLYQEPIRPVILSSLVGLITMIFVLTVLIFLVRKGVFDNLIDSYNLILEKKSQSTDAQEEDFNRKK